MAVFIAFFWDSHVFFNDMWMFMFFLNDMFMCFFFFLKWDFIDISVVYMVVLVQWMGS